MAPFLLKFSNENQTEFTWKNYNIC